MGYASVLICLYNKFFTGFLQPQKEEEEFNAIISQLQVVELLFFASRHLPVCINLFFCFYGICLQKSTVLV